jgi:RNA 3'-terminal phosphate cyclase (ATP)
LPNHFTADSRTAGSTALLLQVALPCLLFSSSTAPSTLALRGGTNATQAPQIDYTQRVLLPFLRRHFGLDVKLNVQRRGYYPKGGGAVFCTVDPHPGVLPPVHLIDRGAVLAIRGESHVAGLPAHVATTMRDAATAKLVAAGVRPDIIDIVSLREDKNKVTGSGSAITLVAETEHGCVLAGSAIGKKALEPADVGVSAADELLRNLAHGGCVDEYLQVSANNSLTAHLLMRSQDQIIIFLALADGKSTVKTGPLTLHTKYAISRPSITFVTDCASGRQFGLLSNLLTPSSRSKTTRTVHV